MYKYEYKLYVSYDNAFPLEYNFRAIYSYTRIPNMKLTLKNLSLLSMLYLLHRDFPVNAWQFMQFEVHFLGLAVLTEKKEDNSPAVARISRRWTPEIGKEKWEEEKEWRLGRNCVSS